MIELTSVYSDPEAVYILYELLKERTPDMSISHSVMPSFEKHEEFVRHRPYGGWYIARDGATPVGSVYLTRLREVGVFIFEAHQGKGYGRQAIKELRRRYPGPLLANVAPTNERSLAFFRKMGGRLIQHTFELPEEVA